MDLKMLNKISTALTLILFITLPSWAYAIQWYDVEIILFRQLSSSGIDNETWDHKLIQPDTAECIDIGYSNQIEAPEETTEDDSEREGTEADADSSAGIEKASKPALPFYKIPKSKLRLRKEATAIAISKDQRVLAHIGWRQPGYSKRNAIPVRINAGPLLLAKPLQQEESIEPDNSAFEQIPDQQENSTSADSKSNQVTAGDSKPNITAAPTQTTSVQTATVTPLTDSDEVINIEITDADETEQQQVIPTSKLNGCITIYRERYLHIITDMVYYHEHDEDIYAEDSNSYSFGKEVTATAIPVKSRRRMRSRELHYIDNPGVGAVILVTPFN